MARTYYPIFFRVIDERGTPIYSSINFKEIHYGPLDKVISSALKKEETWEYVHSPGRRRFRMISTPIYRNGRLVKIVQLGTHLYFVTKSLSDFNHNVLSALPVVLLLGSFGGPDLCQKVSCSDWLHRFQDPEHHFQKFEREIEPEGDER